MMGLEIKEEEQPPGQGLSATGYVRTCKQGFNRKKQHHCKELLIHHSLLTVIPHLLIYKLQATHLHTVAIITMGYL